MLKGRRLILPWQQNGFDNDCENQNEYNEQKKRKKFSDKNCYNNARKLLLQDLINDFSIYKYLYTFTFSKLSWKPEFSKNKEPYRLKRESLVQPLAKDATLLCNVASNLNFITKLVINLVYIYNTFVKE